jgi:hypothetical protein
MEQEMTTRPSTRWRDLVAHLGGGVVAIKAVRVERDFYPIATRGAAARGWDPRKAAPFTIRSPSTDRRQHPLICRSATIRPLKGAATADLPAVILPWDQIELVRVLPDHTNCQ